ncbi:MAG: hypothetical protein GY925_09025 [Actinomycetia bacterium]|nr:hypothetical protein [Actinomycetes bacterium]
MELNKLIGFGEIPFEWTPVDLPADFAYGRNALASVGGEVLVGVDDNTLYRTTDLDIWETHEIDIDLALVAGAMGLDAHALGGGFEVLAVSPDAIVLGARVDPMAMWPNYSDTNDDYCDGTERPLSSVGIVSFDGGASWEPITLPHPGGLDSMNPMPRAAADGSAVIFTAQTDPYIRFIACEGSGDLELPLAGLDASKGLIRLTSSGTLEQLDIAATEVTAFDGGFIAWSPEDPGTVFRSSDGGSTWVETSSEMLLVQATDGAAIGVGANQMWLSLDGGGAWTPMFPTSLVPGAAIETDSGMLAVSTISPFALIDQGIEFSYDHEGFDLSTTVTAHQIIYKITDPDGSVVFAQSHGVFAQDADFIKQTADEMEFLGYRGQTILSIPQEDYLRAFYTGFRDSEILDRAYDADPGPILSLFHEDLWVHQPIAEIEALGEYITLSSIGGRPMAWFLDDALISRVLVGSPILTTAGN